LRGGRETNRGGFRGGWAAARRWKQKRRRNPETLCFPSWGEVSKGPGCDQLLKNALCPRTYKTFKTKEVGKRWPTIFAKEQRTKGHPQRSEKKGGCFFKKSRQ